MLSCPVLQILTLYRTREKSHFPHSFLDLASKIHTHFQTWPLKIPTKRFLNIHFEFVNYSFFLIYLELQRQIRSHTPVVPSKTTPDIQTKLGKGYTPLSDQYGFKNLLLWGGTYLYGLYKGVPHSG